MKIIKKVIEPMILTIVKVINRTKPLGSINFNDKVSVAQFKGTRTKPSKHKTIRLSGVSKPRHKKRLKFLKLMMIRTGILSESDQEMALLR